MNKTVEFINRKLDELESLLTFDELKDGESFLSGEYNAMRLVKEFILEKDLLT